MSRVVERRLVFGPEEKDQCVRFMWLYGRLCGLWVVILYIVGNHFPILMEVPKRPEVLPSDEELSWLVA